MKYIQPLNDPAETPYVNGNIGNGYQGSIIPAQAIEHPMREITHLIKQAHAQEEGNAPAKMGGKIGEPDSANLTQLYHAMRKLCAPAGQIIMWGAGSQSFPEGFLRCDGHAVSRTIYADLYAVLGTRHGVGDGATTFNLPDFRNRFIMGEGAAVTAGAKAGCSSQTVSGNVSGNTNKHTLTTSQMPSHDHRVKSTDSAHNWTGGFGQTNSTDVFTGHSYGTKGWYSTNGSGNNLMENTGGNQGHSHGVNLNFTSNEFDNRPDFITMHYLIRT